MIDNNLHPYAIEMFPSSSQDTQESLASGEVHNILPEEHIIAPEPLQSSTPRSDDYLEELSHTTSESSNNDDNNNRNEQAVNKYNLQRRTTKPVSYKETPNYVKKTIGKQFIQLAKALNPEKKENASIKSSKKGAKVNKRRHKMVIRDTMK